MTSTKTTKYILPIIVISQFLCTSLWFAGNAILPDIIPHFPRVTNLLADLTSTVQFGFIIGTLVFAFFAIADIFAPSKVFFTCGITASLFNLGISLPINDIHLLFLFRFLTVSFTYSDLGKFLIQSFLPAKWLLREKKACPSNSHSRGQYDPNR